MIFWQKMLASTKKEYCEILYEKMIPVYNKTIRDIIEREGANSLLLSTEKSETSPPLHPRPPPPPPPRPNRVKL